MTSGWVWGGGGPYLQHVGHLVPLLGRVGGLHQQLVQQGLLVELSHQLALQALLHKVHQEVHHRLGHAAEGNTGSDRPWGPSLGSLPGVPPWGPSLGRRG